MKPSPFDYLAARDLEEALDALAEHDGEARALAGGLTLRRSRRSRPARSKMMSSMDVRLAIAGAAAEDVDPSSDAHTSADYRRHLVEVLARRALGDAPEVAS